MGGVGAVWLTSHRRGRRCSRFGVGMVAAYGGGGGAVHGVDFYQVLPLRTVQADNGHWLSDGRRQGIFHTTCF